MTLHLLQSIWPKWPHPPLIQQIQPWSLQSWQNLTLIKPIGTIRQIFEMTTSLPALIHPRAIKPWNKRLFDAIGLESKEDQNSKGNFFPSPPCTKRTFRSRLCLDIIGLINMDCPFWEKARAKAIWRRTTVGSETNDKLSDNLKELFNATKIIGLWLLLKSSGGARKARVNKRRYRVARTHTLY